jgi:hypothetical protein
MKRALFILFLIPAIAFGQWAPTNEVNGTYEASSYDLADKSFMGDYFATYFYCMYPQWTNHIYTWSRSGSDWNGDYQNQEEKWCLPLWNSFAIPGWNWVLANDNGGLVSNTTYSAGLLIAAGPPLFYNGTTQTNEGIATAGITFQPLGRIPHDSSDGDSGAVPGNAGSMQLAADRGVAVVDLWHRLWTNGWSTDVVGNRILGFSSGSHPFAAGGLASAMHQLLGLNVETNVGSLTFNWGASTASTNHCTASSISVNGNILTATVHFDRMPLAWDALDGTITNDATGVFIAIPSLSNAFNWIIQVTNLPSGNYEIDVDGHFADSCSSAQLAAGRNWATNSVPTNPLWLQRASVLARKREQKGTDPVTLIVHSAGNSGVLGVGDTINYQSHGSLFYDTDGHRGSTYLSDMASSLSELQQYDLAIHNAAIQTNHTFTITLSIPRLAPFHK